MKNYLKSLCMICIFLVSSICINAQYVSPIYDQPGSYIHIDENMVEIHLKNSIPYYKNVKCFSKNTVMFVDVEYSDVYWAIEDYRKASKKGRRNIIENYKNKGLLVSHSTGEPLGVRHTSGPFELSLYFKVTLKDWKSIYIVDISQYETIAYYVYNKNPKYSTNFDDVNIYKYIDTNYDGIVGIYSLITYGEVSDKYRYGIIKTDSCYYQVQLKSDHVLGEGLKQAGEIIGRYTLYDTKRNIYIYQKRKESLENDWNDNKSFCQFNEEGYVMDQHIERLSQSATDYKRIYPEHLTPSVSPQSEIEDYWTGSAIALKNGYVITNYHVVADAVDINVCGVNGDVKTKYKAEIVASDKNNDLALLKIIDNKYIDIPNPPYTMKTSISEVGEKVWTLGYPLTEIMGTEIKYTEGTISAKSGIKGDITVYQITAPIQPGNSGGPLFDSRGDIIGITSSGLNREVIRAENVNYAIKTSYVKTLIESAVSENIIPDGQDMANKSNVEKIKLANKYIYYLICK